MKDVLNRNLINLAQKLDAPLYLVGGFVRNYLAYGYVSKDIDVASPMLTETLLKKLDASGFSVIAEYKRTGTVVFTDGQDRIEFTSFRTESYLSGGTHTPEKVIFTDDICKDAKRRDFKCNAVYYDIKRGEFVDPLGGIKDINERVLSTALSPEEVFCHDGLRLMRLARFCGELGFEAEKQTLCGAKRYAKNIKDIAAERVCAELKMILSADKKYPFSDTTGHYKGLKILSETGVLDFIMPELTQGRGMEQRKDFHDYDVLEHCLRCAMYAEEKIRLPALLHDVGKPYALKNTGRFYSHPKDGIKIANDILTCLKADKETIERTCFLIGAHMLDLKVDMKENKIKRFIVDNYKYFDDLMLLKTADFRACKDESGQPPTVKRWLNIKDRMVKDGVPFSLLDLKISAKELMNMGYSGKTLGAQLKKLFYLAVEDPSVNDNLRLRKISKKE